MHMSHPNMTKENDELSTLVNINEDACEFYEYAQKKAEDAQVKSAFRNLENLHKNVVNNLQKQIRANGGDSEAKETMTGQVRRWWGELMASVSNDVDETLVNHLEEAEDRCLHSMEDAIQGENLSASTREILQSELTTLRKTHDYMKVLKDTMQQNAA